MPCRYSTLVHILSRQTWWRRPKAALDFLVRPSTMTSRQHSGTELFIDGENPRGDGNTIAAWEGTGMKVGLMRRLLRASQTANGDAIAPPPRQRVHSVSCRNPTGVATVGSSTSDH
jgi:hypothetical protein